MYLDGLGRAFAVFLVLAALAGVLAGALLVWGIPIAWQWLKPWLHAVTG